MVDGAPQTHLLHQEVLLGPGVSVVDYITMMIYDGLKYRTLHSNLAKICQNYDGIFLACSQSRGTQ